MFGSGAMAGTKISRVVGIHTVCNGGEIAIARDGVESREELVLAVIATVRVVRDVKRIRGLVRFNPFVGNTVISNERFGDAAIVRGIAGGKRRNCENSISERPGGSPCEICRIRAARKATSRESSRPSAASKEFSFAAAPGSFTASIAKSIWLAVPFVKVSFIDSSITPRRY